MNGLAPVPYGQEIPHPARMTPVGRALLPSVSLKRDDNRLLINGKRGRAENIPLYQHNIPPPGPASRGPEHLVLLVRIVLFKLGVRFTYMEQREVNLVPFGDLFTPEGESGVMETMLNVVIFKG